MVKIENKATEVKITIPEQTPLDVNYAVLIKLVTNQPKQSWTAEQADMELRIFKTAHDAIEKEVIEMEDSDFKNLVGMISKKPGYPFKHGCIKEFEDYILSLK